MLGGMSASALTGDALIAGGTLMGLFGYNRGNWMFDISMRFERFTAGREFAIAQAEQYREDLKQLSALTQKKNMTYAVVASLCMALCIALYCAGRLGLHGPSPPNWLMGLWYTANAGSFAFQIVTIWLAVHACLRAQTASAHLLTRKTRVPVPTLKQLDKARKFASEFEQADWGDIFRVPYVTNNGAPKTDALDKSSAGRSRSAPPGKRHSKTSSWVREEWETDRAGTVRGSLPTMVSDAAPEHFQLYQQVQKYWFEYDIYARVCLLYGFVCFVQSVGYYGLGHINIEIRCFWVAYAVGFVLQVLLVLLLRFDIIHGRNRQHQKLPHCQWAAPFAWLFAAIGMSLDFQVQFNLTAIAFCWVSVFLAYILQLIFTIRLWEVALPDDWATKLSPEERVGAAWWPDTWKVPSAFSHVLYLVAPPQRLQPGQNDIYREVKEGTSLLPEDVGVGAYDTLLGQVKYLESLFEWAFQDAIMNRMSRSGQSQVQVLYKRFNSARSANGGQSGPDPELARACKDCIEGLNQVIAGEGLQAQPRAAEGNDSGSDSAGSAAYSYGGATSGSEYETKHLPSQNPAREKTKALPPFAQTEHIEPWRLVSSIVVAMIIAWLFLIGGCIVDVVLGEQAFLTAPHWSRPPMTRASLAPHELGTPLGFPWAAGTRPWIPEQMVWHEEKRTAGSQHIGGRRLHEGFEGELPNTGRAGLSAALEGLLSILKRGPEGGAVVPEPVSWPGFFEPQLLACGPPEQGGGSFVAAMTPRGFGAAAHVGHTQRAAPRAAEPFSLSGLTELPPLLSASWGTLGSGTEGLLLVSRGGHLATCPGPRPLVGGTWACALAAGVPRLLPVTEGSQLVAAAAAWLGGRLHAALVDESSPDLVALFTQDGEGAGTSWLPLGEVQVPRDGDATQAPKASLAFTGTGDLLVVTDRGAVLQRRLQDGAVVMSTKHAWRSRDSWRAACSLQHGDSAGSVAHLHLRKVAGSFAQRPEVVTAVFSGGSVAGRATDAFFQ